MNNFCTVLLILTLYSVIVTADTDKTKCEACKDLVEGILKGLDKTKNKNFEGGDVHWEEKNLGKYANSETRLIEVMEHGCDKGGYRCNSLKEEYEEAIEEWFKKRDKLSLHDFLCIEKSKTCCPDGHFGAECKPCPKPNGGEVCFGHGTCKGDGDREGAGECRCDVGYKGDMCDECADQYFQSSKNDTDVVCEKCHESCRTCRDNKSTDCLTCMDGYREQENIENPEERECVDINECEEKEGLCSVGTYCSNTIGSYECKDINECASGAICLGMYEVCVNTYGHYRCECAPRFTRNPATGQCQPDTGIYSQTVPPEGDRKTEQQSERSSKTNNDVEDSLSNEDIARLVVAVVMCILGTAAASGSIFWNLIFFLCLILLAIWWASDKSDKLLEKILKVPKEMRKHTEL